MLRDCNWSLDRDYKTGSDNEPLEFYFHGLAASNEFDLLLGYFSSSAINLLSVGFATFISKGGKMRLVINHLLSAQDKAAISLGNGNAEEISVFDLTDIVSLSKTLDVYDLHFFECLAYLISQKRIDIKVIKPRNGRGIAHYKSGVFRDGRDAVGYQASCNFTYYGLAENIEQLEAFLSWEDGRSSKLIRKQLKAIDDYFFEKDEDVEYLLTNEIEVAIKENFGNKDINELLVQEEQIIRKKQQISSNEKLGRVIGELRRQIDVVKRLPKFPFTGVPRDYQALAYDRWVENNYQGLFSMATGTGKTVTALNCVLNEYKSSGVYRAVITVPTIPLVEQWRKECAKFNFTSIITVSSKENWAKELSFYTTASKLTKTSFIVIVTYSTFVKSNFQAHFAKLPSDVIFIADETHNLGSKTLMRMLPHIHLSKRIGLSATPERQFDEAGNKAIQDFFNDQPPYVASFSLELALKNDFLCKYLYYPHIVRLTDVEMDKYRELSRQLLQMGLFDNTTGQFRSTPQIEMKLLERKRIIHKAANKLEAFRSVLRSEFDKRGHLKYTLVYVPEGLEANYFDIDFSVETEEEVRLIHEYTKVVRQTDESVLVKQFTHSSADRERILDDFERGQIHVLTSMKCLDEGVDVPRSELAIFCSSTGNPRQFIQRRGRVLRLHRDKIHAVIHDLVVVPEMAEDSTYNMERRLVEKELSRVVDFADLAMNKSDTYEVFKETLIYYGLNLNDLKPR
jgi:superfamily II DNA or RNA helicase